MPHRKTFKKHSRVKKVRSGLLKSLAVAMIAHGRIKTTHARAKTLVPRIERYVTYAKRGSLHSVRLLRKDLPSASVRRLVLDIAPRFKDRRGGYTRIIKIGLREGDAAPAVFVEFVE